MDNFTQAFAGGSITVDVMAAEVEERQEWPGVAVRKILQTDRVIVEQLTFSSAQTLTLGRGKQNIYVILSGTGGLKLGQVGCELSRATLLFIPSEEGCEVTLEPTSEELAILALEVNGGNSEKRLREYGSWVDEKLLIVQPDDPVAYSPANHNKTVNHRLFIDEEIEVLRGQLGKGGGAGRHSHESQEQFTYVMEPSPPQLIYTPPGVPHGGNVLDTDFDLLVIYSPPYRESLHYSN